MEELSKIDRANINNKLKELSNRLQIAADNELNDFVDIVTLERDKDFNSIIKELVLIRLIL